jgi:hypothetical protein
VHGQIDYATDCSTPRHRPLGRHLQVLLQAMADDEAALARRLPLLSASNARTC